MKKSILLLSTLLLLLYHGNAQNSIPLDTTNWDIKARSYVLENYKGKPSIYLLGGSITPKNVTFLNGTIEYDIFLKEAAAFPGVYFRINDADSEQFYIRPHQSGNPDANQAAPVTNGISPWQLYYGPRYSFPYNYKYDDWTHVKLVVKGDQAQVYLDHSEKPNLSWHVFHEPREGAISLTGGNTEALHLSNITINKEETLIKDFAPIERRPIEGLIQRWQLSDMFEEKALEDHTRIEALITERSWGKNVVVEEGTAANISREIKLINGKTGNTVFAKITINSNKVQTKILEFGYSDRVVAILNGQPIYKGTNRWRSRDYRYLGTIGLFDAIYLNLKRGKNTLLMAVSEDFGGWLITGKITDTSGIKIE